MIMASEERDAASSEVDTHNLPTEKIQAEKTIDTCTRRKRVSQYWELIALLAQ
ncbi:MAG: hypothetical protein NTZ17_12135 [Phycisphaerae bacterium]|nr:hypothetical protein [Phycisphaerae bacterium]